MLRRESKANTNAQPRMDLGWVGILMIAVSVLYILSLLSFDPADPPQNLGDQNEGYLNMIGSVGAYLSFGSFFTIGFAASFWCGN